MLSDNEYQGPCPECCDCSSQLAAFIITNPILTVILSGIDTCFLGSICGNSGGFDNQIVGPDLDGTYFLTFAGGGANWSLTIPHGITFNIWSSTDGSCTGTITSVSYFNFILRVQIECTTDPITGDTFFAWAFSFTGNNDSFIFFQTTTRMKITLAILNSLTGSCSGFALEAFNGTATLPL